MGSVLTGRFHVEKTRIKSHDAGLLHVEVVCAAATVKDATGKASVDPTSESYCTTLNVEILYAKHTENWDDTAPQHTRIIRRLLYCI